MAIRTPNGPWRTKAAVATVLALVAVAVLLLGGILSIPLEAPGTHGDIGSRITPDGPPTVSNITYKSTGDALTLSYLEYLPSTFANSTTYPLVVFLHGAGTGTVQNITGGVGGVQNPGQLQNNSSAYGYIEISLNTRSNQPYFINTPCGGPQAQDVADAINSEKTRHKINGIYLVGFSAGSSGALELAGHGMIAGLRGVATTGTITDIFQVFSYLNTTGSTAHYTGWEAAECNHYLSPQNATQWRTAAYESVFRFVPQNFSGLQLFLGAGARDATAPSNPGFWPSYSQVNSTVETPNADVALALGEPLNTSHSDWNLTGGSNLAVVWSTTAGHSFNQIDYAKMFEFFAGRLSAGFYTDSGAAGNASWATNPGIPIGTFPTTPIGAPPPVLLPVQTPYFACATGTGGVSASGKITANRGDTLVVIATLGAQKVSSVTDAAGDTFGREGIGFHVGADRVEAWVVNHTNGNANNQVTVSLSVSGLWCFFYADFNWTNSKGVSIGGTNGTATSGTCSSSVTTTTDNNFVLLGCMISASVTATAGASTTILDQTAGSRTGVIAYSSTTNGATYSPSVTFTSNAWAGYAVAIHPIVNSSAPTGLAAAAVSGRVATLTWVNPSTILIDNLVFQGSTCGGGIATKVGVTANDTVSGLTPGSSYCFWVQAVNASGVSANSATVSFTAPTVPPAVLNLTVITVTVSTITLGWTNPGLDTNDTLFWGLTCATLSPYSFAPIVGGSLGVVSSVIVQGAVAATRYCFAIAATNTTGLGVWAFVNGTTSAAPPGGGTPGAVGSLVVGVALVGTVAAVITGLGRIVDRRRR